jgi:multicomponent Na+:H+ antiporter subunit E
MMRKAVFFLFALAMWMLLSWPFDRQHLITGSAVSLLITLLTGDMFVNRPHLFKNPGRYLWFLSFIPVFLWECLKANIEVACLVAHPDTPINPGIVRIRTGLKSDTGLTFLANAITLTPGTMSVDIDRENGCLYVHWIRVNEKDMSAASKAIAGKFESILARIFE